MLEILLFLFCISILVTSFSLFKLNDTLNEWFLFIEGSVASGLVHIAYFSPKHAFEVLHRYFFYIGWGVTIPQLIIQYKFGVMNELLLYTGLTILYISFSLFTWVNRRDEVTKKLASDYVKDVCKVTKWSFVLFFILFIGYSSVQLQANPKYVPEIIPASFAFLITVITVALSFGVANLFLYALFFAPAIVAILYVILVIYTAKILRALGKNFIINVFVLYFIVGSIYMAVLTYQGLKG